MNQSDENTEPKIDLELTLNYSAHCTQKDSDDDSGAGAGAGANAASRVDMSFVTNNPVSELVWSPVKGPRVKYADSSFIDKKTCLFRDAGPSNVIPPLQGMIGGVFNPEKIIDNNDTGCESKIGLSVSHVNQKDHTLNSSGKDIHVQAEVINSGVLEKNETLFDIPGYVEIKTLDNLAEQTSTDLPMNEQCDGNIGCRNKILEADDTVGFRNEASGDQVTSSVRLVTKEEFTAENEFQTVGDGISTAAVCKIAISLSCLGNESKCQGNDELAIQCYENSQPTCCPTSSRTGRYMEKCKGKALSDGDERISSEDDDSHESVESCNSTGQFSTGKRQWNFKQQYGSKRVKRSFQANQDSPPYIRRDSSFMNWISNMMNGFSQLRQDEVIPPALTFDNDHEMLDQKLVKSGKDQDPGFRSGGFQSVFQSIYSSSSKNTETRRMSMNQMLKANAKNVQLVNKVTSNTPMPIAYCPQGGSYCKQVVQPGERIEGSEFVPLSKAEVPRKMNIGTDVVFEVMPSPILDARNLHIPDASCSKLLQAMSSETNEEFRTEEDKEHSTDEKLQSETRHTHWGAVCNECSGAKTVKPQKSIDDQNTYPSPKLKNLQVMASLFSGRLDSQKHNEPSNLKDDPSRANMTCFFCGVKGHHVHNCRETSGDGVKGLPRDMNPCEKLEEYPCMYADHSDFNPSPEVNRKVSGKHVSRVSTSVNHNTRGMYVNDANEDNPSHIACEGNFQAPTACDAEQRLKEGIHSMKKSNKLLSEDKLVSENSIHNKVEEYARIHTHNTDEQQVSNAPKGIFEAIKTLQLSRSDILKWINSPMSASHLDGFFLRLRLRNLEECLGGTGYHVASIIGSHRQSLLQNPKTSVSVNVNGVKCLVESQYISNHHFLEDEVMAWWSATSMGGDNLLLSEKDLVSRIKKKESLGF